MKKKLFMFGMTAVCMIGLTACNTSEKTAAKPSEKTAETKQNSETTKPVNQTITYLNKEYTIPNKVTKIAAASLEAMEDAAILGVKPAGAITIGGKLPEYVADDLQGAESIGEKTQPNFETLLTLKPDVILGTDKFQPDVAEQLKKIAPMFPISHISTDWKENLKLLAELTGKQSKADNIIKQYEETVKKVKDQAGEDLKDKKAVIVRIRGGSLFLYPQDVYLNPVLYADLGMTVPEEIKAVKAQEAISLEKFAEMNPDYIYLQFEESENADKPKALEELENNPIWNSIQAVKNKQVFVNAIDPMYQGGTALSKTTFLKAVEKTLLK